MTEGDGDVNGYDRHGRLVAGVGRSSTGRTAGHAELPYLPIAEAAAAHGIHPEKLRSMVRREQIPARRDNRGKWLVQAPAGHDSAQPANGRSVAGHEEALAELREELAETRITAARLEGQIEVAKAVAAAEVASAKAETEAALRHIALLDDLLADARRPWWRRLLG